MSRRRAGLSPTLFPFLAVLVCTLGTLILLLALVAQEARDAAAHNAKVKQQASTQTSEATLSAPKVATKPIEDGRPQLTVEAADQLLQQESFRVTELVSFRDAQTADLERRRDELTQVEAATRELSEKLKRLNAEVEAATSPDEALRMDARTLVMMRDEVKKLQAEVKELEESKRGAKPRVVIVPHQGPNGTQRRPIYVQCTEEGVTIMPEGSQISHAQLIAAGQSRSPRSNPLDAALRAVRRHAMRVYGDTVPPYPLLVVRPDGIHTYIAARNAMKDWDDQYGYELVPGEVELAFPERDETLHREVELAIHEAKARQYYGGSRGIGSGRGGDGRGTTGNGSYAQRGGSGRFNTPTSTNGNRSGDPGETQVNQYASGAQAAGSPFPSSNTKPPKPLPTLSARSLDLQAQSNGFKLAKDHTFSPTGSSPLTESVPGSGQQSFGASGQVESASEALNKVLQEDFSGAGNDSPGGIGEFAGTKPGQDANDWTGTTENQFANQGQPDSQGGPQSQTMPQMQGMPQTQGMPQMQGIPAGQNGQGESAMTAAQTAYSDQQNPADQRQAAPNQLPQQQRSYSQQGSQSQSGSASMADAQSPPSGSPSAGSPPSGSPPPGATPSASGGSNSSPMVQRDGKDWALPSSMAGRVGTEVVRPIALRCNHDRYELLDRGRVVQVFEFRNVGVYKSTLQLPPAVRDRVGNWGATLPGGRWQPRLDVSVGPHADQRFHELQTLMQGSGVDVIRRSP